MKTLFFLLMTGLMNLTIANAATNLKTDISAKNKIASCISTADEQSQAESVTVYFKGGNANDKSRYSILYTAGTLSKNFPAQELEWLDSGTTLGLRFANFLLVSIRQGKSSDSTIGVELGAPPHKIACEANLPRN